MTRTVRKHRTLGERSLPRLVLATLVAGVLLCGPCAADAAGSPEQQCQESRCAAAGKYAACQQKVLGKLYGGGYDGKYQFEVWKCTRKYTAVWPMLQVKASGTGATCDNPRFEDNGDGTVTDRLTALQWEKKQNLDSVANGDDPHDADNSYSWSATGTTADGAAFTEFLAALNNGTCFAGQCDWRLPTLGELYSILLAPSPLGGIDPIFGQVPGGSSRYWSSTSDQLQPTFASFLFFRDGSTSTASKTVANLRGRAVRGGL
jgi:hypothetical protein